MITFYNFILKKESLLNHKNLLILWQLKITRKLKKEFKEEIAMCCWKYNYAITNLNDFNFKFSLKKFSDIL
jgi:hypothetical protein